jgi:hypothetical protein
MQQAVGTNIMARIILSSKFCLSRFGMTYARFTTLDLQNLIVEAGDGLDDKNTTIC